MLRRRSGGEDVVSWAGKRCLALTTYRRDGSAVTTPVWFVIRDGELCVWTGPATGKAKRLRRDPRCSLAPCTVSGRVTGAAVDGRARFLPAVDGPAVQRLLRTKYPVQKRALEAYGWLRRRGRPAPEDPSVYIAIAISD